MFYVLDCALPLVYSIITKCIPAVIQYNYKKNLEVREEPRVPGLFPLHMGTPSELLMWYQNYFDSKGSKGIFCQCFSCQTLTI